MLAHPEKCYIFPFQQSLSESKHSSGFWLQEKQEQRTGDDYTGSASQQIASDTVNNIP
jgi:hypothetical protein